jgi:hypothetical protein
MKHKVNELCERKTTFVKSRHYWIHIFLPSLYSDIVKNSYGRNKQNMIWQAVRFLFDFLSCFRIQDRQAVNKLHSLQVKVLFCGPFVSSSLWFFVHSLLFFCSFAKGNTVRGVRFPAITEITNPLQNTSGVTHKQVSSLPFKSFYFCCPDLKQYMNVTRFNRPRLTCTSQQTPWP